MTDVVVIGAGMAGIAAASEAARAGATVTLVDAGLAGRATTAGAGIVSPIGLDRGTATRPWLDLIAEGVNHLRAQAEALDADVRGSSTYSACGELVVATDEEERARLSELETQLWVRSGDGVAITGKRLVGRDVVDAFPWARPDLEALFIAEVGRIDGDRFAAALLDHACRVGPGRITVLEGHLALELADGGARPILDGHQVDGDAFVVATGAWASSWADPLGIRVGIRSDAGQITHLRPLDVPSSGLPVVNTFDGSYLVPFEDRVAVGATHEHRPDLRTDVTAGGQHQVLTRALAIAPGLAPATLVETRVGIRPTSEDGFPLVGPTAVPGVAFVGGLGSWGLTLGPLLGAVAARTALGEPLPDRFQAHAATREVARTATPPTSSHRTAGS